MKHRIDTEKELEILENWHKKANNVSRYTWDGRTLVLFGLGKPQKFTRRQVESVIFANFSK